MAHDKKTRYFACDKTQNARNKKSEVLPVTFAILPWQLKKKSWKKTRDKTKFLYEILCSTQEPNVKFRKPQKNSFSPHKGSSTYYVSKGFHHTHPT